MDLSRFLIPPGLAVSIAVLAASALAVTGCGEDQGGGRTQVVATTGILADVAGEVAGPDAEVVQLVPEGADPHSFSLSAEDRQELEQADLIVANGAGLEAGIPVEESDAPVWELTSNAGELLSSAGGGEAAVDPHVWMDPTRVADALPSLATALADADRAHARGYEQRAAAYARRLRALDRQVSETLAEVPRGDRELVTSHDALGYLADRYGFEVVATAFPATGAEAEASAARLAEVEAAVRESGVATIFAQDTDDPEVLDAIGSQTGVEVSYGLLVESPGPADGYAEMLRRDAELIATGLRG